MTASLLGIIAAHASVAAGYAATVLADGPAVYCRLDDASGNFADSSGNGRTATVTGTPTYLQPPAGSLITGNSITFAGSQYGDLGTVTFLNSLVALSLEAWFKTTNTGANLNMVARDATSGASLRGWRMRMVTGQVNAIVFTNNSALNALLTSPLTYNDGNWHHAVVTANADPGGNGRAILYIDGVSVVNVSMSPPMATTNIVGEHAYIGAAHAAGTWIGGLDEVAIYTNDLSATQVVAHYNAGH